MRRNSPSNLSYPSPALTIAALGIFSGFVTGYFFLRRGTLYWDTARLFTQFRDVLQSLNDFGELPWWFPHNQNGFPGYYQWILNTSGATSPLFVVVALFVWLAGRMGVHLKDYQSLYVVYFSFLTPTLFLSALYGFSRFFFQKRVVTFLLVGAAFSPGVMLNVSDIGFLEPAAYTLFLFAAYLGFLRRPDSVTFRRLALTAGIFVVSASNAYLYWAVIVGPLFLAVTFDLKKIRSAIEAIPRGHWLMLAGLLGAAALPAVITYFQIPDIVRSSLAGEKSYPYARLAAGNPLEWLTVSTPGVGFDWNEARDKWSLLSFSKDHHTAYYYLGALTLPLALWGLITAPRRVRTRLFILLAVFSLVISLSAYSPIFSSVLLLKTPLRLCNHYSDVTFKAGGYLIVLFAAGYGVRAWLRGRSLRGLMGLTILSLFFNVGAEWVVNRASVVENVYLGFYLSVGFLSLVVIAWTLSARRPSDRVKIYRVFIALFVTDVATHAFLYSRLLDESTHKLNSGWLANSVIDQTPAPTKVGLKLGNHPHYYANHFLMLKPNYEMLAHGFDPARLPLAAVYDAAHVSQDYAVELSRLTSNSLPLAEVALATPEFSARLAPQGRAVASRIEITLNSYNEWTLDVRSPRAGILFLRDAYSQNWRAEVNGTAAPLARAFYHFKAVPVPAGLSQVKFYFRVPWVGTLAALIYLCLSGIGVKVIVDSWEGQRGWRLLIPAFETR